MAVRNAYSGETGLTIGDAPVVLVYDWEALAVVKTQLGKDGLSRALDGVDFDALAAVLAAGLARHNPEWTAERIKAESPPVMPTIKVVTEALDAAYWGPNGAPEETDENPQKPTLRTRLKGLWRRLFVAE